MGSPEEKERHQVKRKNKYAKLLRDQNDFKGAFTLKVYDDERKYKRKRITIKDIEELNEDYS